jgi:asparagine synthase (glutamine-hydrolysing)
MLALRIARHELAAGRQVHSLTPFEHPHLESNLTESANGFTLLVRERSGFESLRLTIDTQARALEIEAGPRGTAPLYLFDAGHTLYGSWDVAALYRHLPRDPLDFAAAARFLARFEHPYSRRTLFRGVSMLTERATARWSADERLRIEYPDAMRGARPRALRDGADPPAIATEILTASMRCSLRDGAIGADLSGGLDSGIVAAIASELLDAPLRTYGLVQPGDERAGQVARRDEFIARFGFIDTSVDAIEHPPLVAKAKRVVPWEEIYTDATDALRTRAVNDGVSAMLTGIGGDELCKLHRGEDDTPDEDGPLPPFLTRRAVEALRDEVLDAAPLPSASYSSYEGLAACSPLYLRRGLWPLAPLTTPELFWFARSLPAEWRRGRRLSREMLARRGCPRAITHPASTENFLPLFLHAMTHAARPRIRELFDDSRLAAMGLVDLDMLRAGYDDVCEANAMPFYSAAILELTLRCVEEARA